MFSALKGFQVIPRGSKQSFPIQLAPDGTPCILASPKQPVRSGKTVIVFPANNTPPKFYPSTVEGKNLYVVTPGDFLGVYTVTSEGTMLQSFLVKDVQSDTLEAVLADTLITSH